MTISVWPANAASGAPAYSGRMLRQTSVAVSVAGASGGRPLGARSGVRPGTGALSLTTPSTTTWQMAPFAGVIDGESANEAGPYAFSSDAVVSGSLVAADGTNPRMDIVYVQVSDPSEGDGTTTPQVQVLYLAGSANATPAAPATPARSFVLGQINVPKSGGGSPTVTWTAPVAVGGGGIVPVLNYTEMANLSGYLGQYAHLLTDGPVGTAGLWEYNPGGWNVYGGWQPVGAGARGIGSPTAGAGWALDGTQTELSRTGNLVYGSVLGNSTGTIAAGQTIAVLPVNFRPTVPYSASATLTTGTALGIAAVLIKPDGTCNLQYVSNTTAKTAVFSFNFRAV